MDPLIFYLQEGSVEELLDVCELTEDEHELWVLEHHLLAEVERDGEEMLVILQRPDACHNFTFLLLIDSDDVV